LEPDLTLDQLLAKLMQKVLEMQHSENNSYELYLAYCKMKYATSCLAHSNLPLTKTLQNMGEL